MPEWDASPTSSPVVSRTTRGPAKPMTAPSSTARSWHSDDVGGEHAAGGRRAVDHDGEQAGGAVALDRGRGATELDQSDHPLLHAGAAATGHADDRQPEVDRTIEGPADLLAGHHAHRPAEHVEAALDQHVVLGAAGADRLLGRVLQRRRVPGEVQRSPLRRSRSHSSSSGRTAQASFLRAFVSKTGDEGTQDRSAEVDGDLVGEQPAAPGQAGPRRIDLEQTVEQLEVVLGERVGGHAVDGAEPELQAFEPPALGIEALVGRLGRAVVLDRVT